MSSELHSSDPGLPSVSFIVWSSGFVFLMTPGLGLFYSGLSRSKNALSNMMMCMLAYCVVTVQWVLFGFSLSFSETASNGFIGNFNMAGLTGVASQTLPLTAPQVPAIAFCLYQMQFATITAAIIFGSVSERARLFPGMVFCFVWTTLVYNVVAYWTWGARGWSKNIACLDTIGSLDTAPCGIGSYDYAGGGPVHVASGFAGLAYCLIVGPRARKGSEEFKAHNLMNVFLGTALLWFGWLGFNGGSAIASTPRAALAAFVTMVSASCGALTWASIVQVTTKKWSAEAFCAGAVAGLVGITPASGFVAPWAAIVIGVTSGALGCYSVRLKHMFGFDDTLDAFGLHGVIGAWGNIMTGIFATKWVAALDGAAINGGFIDGNFIQMGYQLADTVAVAAYSFTVSYAILFIMNKVPGLSLRSKDEVIGCDLGEMGEVAYEAVSVTTSSDPLMDMKKGPKESSEVTMEVA